MTVRLATYDDIGPVFGWGEPPTPGYSSESDRLREVSKQSIAAFFSTEVTELNLLGADPDARLRLSEMVLRGALQAYRSLLPIVMYDRIENRIATLHDPDEWGDQDLLPDTQSFVSMLKFLCQNRSLKIPSISINRHGFFSASWRPSRTKLASLVFQPNGHVSWLVFVPQRNDDEDAEEAAGVATAERTIEILDNFDALHWMTKTSPIRRAMRVIGLG